VVNQVKDLEPDRGFDAQNDRFVNMIDSGIIDPAKVVRSALQNAVSIAGLMLTTEALVSEVPEKKKDVARMAGGMGEDSWR
jgi:chaperonin GroEL